MRFLLIIAFIVLVNVLHLATPYQTRKLSSVYNNRTPKKYQRLEYETIDSMFSNACFECEQIIRHLRDVIKNPHKLRELKLLLNILCHQTTFEAECKLFVENIDVMADRLLPYLSDPHHVCQEMHICGNEEIEKFHNIGTFFAKQMFPTDPYQAKPELLCEECQFAAHELDELIQRPEFQRSVKHWISKNICAHFGPRRGSCDVLVDDFLPEFLVEFHNILQNNKQFCIDLELCSSSGSDENSESVRWGIGRVTNYESSYEPRHRIISSIIRMGIFDADE